MSIFTELDIKTRDEIDLFIYENLLPTPIQRIFFLKELQSNSIRGGNKSNIGYEGIICIKGYCKVKIIKNDIEEIFSLDTPAKCIIVEPDEWHQVYDFQEDSIVMAFSDRLYNPEEYAK